MGDNSKKYKMKQGIVKFSKEYVTETGLKEWVGVEIEFDANNETALEALRRAEDIVRQHQQPKKYLMQYEGCYPAQAAPSRTSEDERVAKLIAELYACTELNGDDGLLSYQKPAAQNRETQNVFDIMFKKLSSKK